jgi:hypothetical protein
MILAMKVLAATGRGQGMLEGDFDHCVDGELLIPFLQECEDPDLAERCGCVRAFGGLATSGCTTTAAVVDRAITTEELSDAVRSSIHRQGWLDLLHVGEVNQLVAGLVADVLEVASDHPVGSVLQRHGGDVLVRVGPG